MLNKYFIRTAVFFSMLCLTLLQSDLLNAQDGWEQMKSMSVKRMAHGSAVYNDNIYVFGGRDLSFNWYSSGEVYDVSEDNWFNLASLELPSGYHSIQPINDKIYIVGGTYQGPTSGEGLNTTLTYDPQLDSWSEMSDCPSKTGQMASCVYDSKFYLFGGYIFPDITSEELLTRVYTFDPEIDSWDSVASMPNPHIGGKAVTLNGKIYVIGGVWAYLVENNNTGKLDRYDPETDTWTEMASMPYPVIRHECIVYRDKIYVFGGETGDYIFGENSGSTLIQEYDPVTNQWQEMEGMKFVGSGFTGQVIEDSLYLIGGTDESGNIRSETWKFDLTKLAYKIVDNENSITKSPSGLLQNFPNPFTDKTNISYELNSSTHVQIVIYDLTGNSLYILLNKNQSPGKYDIEWIAKDLSPGIYFCKIQVNGYAESIRLIKE